MKQNLIRYAAIVICLLAVASLCNRCQAQTDPYTYLMDVTLTPLQDDLETVVSVNITAEAKVRLETCWAAGMPFCYNDSAYLMAGWSPHKVLDSAIDPIAAYATPHRYYSKLLNGSDNFSLIVLWEEGGPAAYVNHIPVRVKWWGWDHNTETGKRTIYHETPDAALLYVPDSVSATVRKTEIYVEAEADDGFWLEDRQWASSYYENVSDTDKNLTVYYWDFINLAWKPFGHTDLIPLAAPAKTSGLRFCNMELTPQLRAEGIRGLNADGSAKLRLKVEIWCDTPPDPATFPPYIESTTEIQ